MRIMEINTVRFLLAIRHSGRYQESEYITRARAKAKAEQQLEPEKTRTRVVSIKRKRKSA